MVPMVGPVKWIMAIKNKLYKLLRHLTVEQLPVGQNFVVRGGARTKVNAASPRE